MNYYDSYRPSLPCPIKAGWKTTGHHGNRAESVATPWKSDAGIWLNCTEHSRHIAKWSSPESLQIFLTRDTFCLTVRLTWIHIRWNGSPWQPALWIPQLQGQTCCLSGTVSPTLSVAFRDRRMTKTTRYKHDKQQTNNKFNLFVAYWARNT